MRAVLDVLNQERVQTALLATFGFCVFFVNLWQGPLGGDESCYALLAREILRTGDWAVLHHPTYDEWASFYEHPPLYMWATALNFLLFGVNDFAAKVFSASTGFATVVLVLVAGRRMGGHRTAILAATMLCLTLFFVDYGRKARLENPLTFFVFASFVAVTWRGRQWWPMVLGGMAMGLGFLVKGMPAFACGVVAVGAVALERGSIVARIGRLAAFGGGALVVLAPWAIVQFVVDDGRFFDWYANRQVEWSLGGRTADGSSLGLSLGGFVYYARHLFGEIMVPWGLFGLAGVVEVVRRRRPRAEHTWWIAILAVVVVFGVFAVVPFRKARYILPVVPFLALLAGHFFARPSWSAMAVTGATRLVAFLFVAMVAVASFTPAKFYTKKDGDFLPLRPHVDAVLEADAPILVGGMRPYTVRQVFTWYFDRPHAITPAVADFEAAWSRGDHAAAIFRHDPTRGPAPSMEPAAVSGRYLLFVRDRDATVRY